MKLASLALIALGFAGATNAALVCCSPKTGVCPSEHNLAAKRIAIISPIERSADACCLCIVSDATQCATTPGCH